jgi:hypothetical protein
MNVNPQSDAISIAPVPFKKIPCDSLFQERRGGKPYGPVYKKIPNTQVYEGHRFAVKNAIIAESEKTRPIYRYFGLYEQVYPVAAETVVSNGS